MAGKNQVELTFAGDADQLVKAEQKAEQTTKDLAQSVGKSADDIKSALDRVGDSGRDLSADVDKSAEDLKAAFDKVGKASKQTSDDVGKAADRVGDGFDRAGEAADTLDTRAMGARDTLTGLQDSMASVGEISRGNLMEGLLLAGSGLSDLGSGLYNALIPGLKAAVSRIGAFKLALAGIGIAAGAALVGIAAWGEQARHTSDNIQGLTEDIKRFVKTGQTTATLKRLFGEGAEGVAEFKDKLDVATAGFSSWSDHLNRSFDDISRSKSAFKDLDTALSNLVDQGYDADQVFNQLVTAYDLNDEQVEKLRKVLPKYAEAAQRAKDRTQDLGTAQGDAAQATIRHANSVKELADAIKAQTDPVFAFINAQRQVKQAQDAVKEAADKYGKKSPEYRQAVEDLAQAQIDLYAATGDVAAASDEDLIPALAQLKHDGYLTESSFNALKTAIDNARKAAEKADGTRIDLNTALAQSKVVEIQRKIKDIKGKTVTITIKYVQKGTGDIHVSGPHGGGTLVRGAAEGEYVTGPGPKGRDSVLRLVAPGEYIVPAEDVDAAGGKAGFEAVLDALHTRHALPAAVMAAQQPVAVRASAPVGPRTVHLSSSGSLASLFASLIRSRQLNLVVDGTRVMVA